MNRKLTVRNAALAGVPIATLAVAFAVMTKPTQSEVQQNTAVTEVAQGAERRCKPFRPVFIQGTHVNTIATITDDDNKTLVFCVDSNGDVKSIKIIPW